MRTMTKHFVELVAAGGLVLALAAPAISAETTGRSVATEPAEAWDTGQTSGDVPFPHLPWMATDSGQPATVAGLAGPQLQTLGPFLLQPSMPPTRFSSGLPSTTSGMRSE